MTPAVQQRRSPIRSQPKGPVRILITRLSAIGDCILTMPLLCALRDAHPDAFIAWLVERGAAPLLESHPALDRLIVVEKGWLKSLRSIRRLRRELLDMHFDICIDPQSLTKSSAAARLSAAPRRIGFAAPLGREAAPWLNTELVRPAASHIVERQLELLAPLGIEPTKPRFDAPRNPAADDAMARFIARAHLRVGFAVINCGAGWDSKIWPARRFARVARHLGERHRLPSVVVWAGERECGWAHEIAEGAAGHALVAPSTNLQELAALLRTARLFVGCDTGPLHLAAAVDTPCVGLYGPTLPEDCGPYGEQHIVVQKMHTPAMRKATDAAMQAIDIDSVCAACDAILAQDAGGAAQAPAA